MRSFLLFLIKNHVFFIFMMLELAALYLIVTNNRYQQTFFVNSANAVTGDVLNTYDNLTSYFYLREVNDSLMQENAQLKARLFTANDDSVSSIMVVDTANQPLYSYVPATVINNTFALPNNYLTINKGSLNGIEKDMGVVTSSGIVGIVKEVSPRFSVVLSVLHGSFHTRVAVQRNNEQGRMVWDSKDPTMVKVVDVSEPGVLYPGDSIVTTSYSMAFPPGYPVGTLESYGKTTGSNFYTLNVKLATDFSSIQYVYVIDYLYKEEQGDLESENMTNASN